MQILTRWVTVISWLTQFPYTQQSLKEDFCLWLPPHGQGNSLFFFFFRHTPADAACLMRLCPAPGTFTQEWMGPISPASSPKRDNYHSSSHCVSVSKVVTNIPLEMELFTAPLVNSISCNMVELGLLQEMFFSICTMKCCFEKLPLNRIHRNKGS